MVFAAGALAATLLSMRSLAAAEAGHGEYHALLLISVLGMVVLAGATNLVMLFIGFELLSIPLYVLCATELRREHSLESGLKYLIIGSLGSAVLLYGLAHALRRDGLDRLRGDRRQGRGRQGRRAVRGGARADRRPGSRSRRRWRRSTSGRPTSTRARRRRSRRSWRWRRRRRRSGCMIRLFDGALIGASSLWAPAFATLAVVTIVVGNVGAIGQSSVKRMLAYSSVAQAGYILAGLVVSTQARGERDRLLPVRVHGDEPRGVRGGRGARARDALRRRPAARCTGSAPTGRGWRGR